MTATDALLQAGLAHHKAGRLAQADAQYRALAAADPANADAPHLLGVLADLRGDHVAALALIDHALTLGTQPRYHNNRAMVLNRLARHADALAAAQDALKLRPAYAEAFNNQGIALEGLGRPAEAAASYQAAIARRPSFADAWSNLGNTLKRMGQVAQAMHAYTQAAEHGAAQAGDSADAHANLANAYQQMGRPDLAEAACRHALALRPGFQTALLGVARALLEQDRPAEAEAQARRAIVADPRQPAAYRALATALNDQNRQAEAMAVLDLALALQPGDVDTHEQRAFILLLMGRLAEGWPEYEYRFRSRQGRADQRGFVQPMWQDQDLRGRTILLHAEQGFGDTLQFVRYVPMVAARGARVVLEVQPPLLTLLAGLPGVAQLVARGDALPDFDLHCPLLSLPHRFGTTLDDIPAAPPYLQPQADRLAHWRGVLPPGGHKRVAIAWAGNPLHVNDRRRSPGLAALQPLFARPELQWVSVQTGPRTADLQQAGLPVQDLSPGLHDFNETAAALAQCDLLIAPDTAVAHLAGALNLPVFLLLPFAPDWRWLAQGQHSGWYPNTRLFRQDRNLQWGSVIQHVSERL